jgi:hypothetical protein
MDAILPAESANCMKNRACSEPQGELKLMGNSMLSKRVKIVVPYSTPV